MLQRLLDDPAACFGLDGKMPQGDGKSKEMAMMLCSPNCKKALKSKDCKGAGWNKEMTQKVLGNCKSLDEAKVGGGLAVQVESSRRGCLYTLHPFYP